MAEINAEQVKKIARLARLQIDEGALTEYEKNLSNIITLFDKMAQVNTDDIEPMAHPLDISQPLRQDDVTEVDQRENLLEMAPKVEAGLFLVPQVIE